jgi:hypothetical protein
MADTEFGNKLNAGLRYGATVGGTAFALMGVVSLLSPDQVAELKTQLEIFNQSVFSAYGALTKMWVILGPVAIAFCVKLGISSSTVKGLAGKLLRIAANAADPKATEAKVAIVNAAASPTIGSQGVVNPELAKLPETSANVVSSAAAVPPAPPAPAPQLVAKG